MSHSKAATAAAVELVEQAQNCTDLAADQHKIAEKLLVCAQETVEKQHKTADKLEELGANLIDQAIHKTGVAEVKAMEEFARTHCN